ncbi:PepSY domain-containing protein [Pseudomonas sp. D2-30]|uniref:PepSY domain-containing protein n=1 Tax=unclassified Pseudomonas TaxID=196821 RepID=UPI003DA9E930
MNRLTAFILVTLMAFGAGLAQARDLHRHEIKKLVDAGTILPFDKLNEAALAEHPDGTVIDSELEDEYGKYRYKVDLRDADGIEWELELDAVSGKVLKNHQDT